MGQAETIKASIMAEREKFNKRLAQLEEDVYANFKKDWDKSAELRQEFGGNFKAYVAYMTAKITGRARILGER